MKRTPLKRTGFTDLRDLMGTGPFRKSRKRLRAKPKQPQSLRERKLSREWYEAVVPKKLRRTHEGHHVVPQEKLKQKYAAAAGEIDLPGILWDARNGLAVPKRDHARHTSAFRRLRRADLRPENLAFAAEHGFDWYIEKHYV